MATKTKLQPTGGNLPRKYRPASLAEIRGQAWAVEQLTAFAAAVKDQPTSAAFISAAFADRGRTAFDRRARLDHLRRRVGGAPSRA